MSPRTSKPRNADGGIIDVGNGLYLVPSSSEKGEHHRVTVDPPTCTCMAFVMKRNRVLNPWCKHLTMVSNSGAVIRPWTTKEPEDPPTVATPGRRQISFE